MNRAADTTKPPRRKKALVSIWGTTQLHLRSPIVIGFWSAIFPGMGHMLLGKYIRGFILFAWEVAINLLSSLNMAIFYTFTFRFEEAKQVLDLRWLMLYIPTYLFAIWDSSRVAASLNNQFLLAAREDEMVKPFVLHPLGMNYLDKSVPWTAAFWSALSTGAGQLISHRIVVAFFLLGWWVAVVCCSNVLTAIHMTAYGQFEQAKGIVNIQWLLNVPSIFFFGIYDAYVNAVESNKLFEWEQDKFLKNNYQSASFSMPLVRQKDCNMYIVSTFEQTLKIETAITAIEMKGVPRENIFAVPMDKQNEDRMLFDRMHSSDSLSMFDVPMILAALFALFGLIYGFLLEWGPILWALIGTGFGFFLGLGIKLITTKRKNKKQKGKQPEVVLIISCKDEQLQMVQDTLWAYSATGVAKVGAGG